jgi:hypothetical protein
MQTGQLAVECINQLKIIFKKNFLPYVANTHTDTNRDIEYILNAISELAKNHSSWIKNYEVNLFNSEIKSKTYNDKIEKK